MEVGSTILVILYILGIAPGLPTKHERANGFQGGQAIPYQVYQQTSHCRTFCLSCVERMTLKG